ncbi:uncharacterized protein K441DRAFT_668993 [Cenococcum geophilum 1.58]|uniref:uncharacterized protein n=1 Tax=Cenococcum geophilum 1.58 TaxID=794803 RepID=UPI00358FD938|nr:hypothetical protein K441DRAFT_668993 [Cenococcum geophilum 1.58]
MLPDQSPPQYHHRIKIHTLDAALTLTLLALILTILRHQYLHLPGPATLRSCSCHPRRLPRPRHHVPLLRARTPLLRHPLDATHLLQRRVRAPYHAHLARLRHHVILPLPRARVRAQRLGEEDGHAPAVLD